MLFLLLLTNIAALMLVRCEPIMSVEKLHLLNAILPMDQASLKSDVLNVVSQNQPINSIAWRHQQQVSRTDAPNVPPRLNLNGENLILKKQQPKIKWFGLNTENGTNPITKDGSKRTVNSAMLTGWGITSIAWQMIPITVFRWSCENECIWGCVGYANPPPLKNYSDAHFGNVASISNHNGKRGCHGTISEITRMVGRSTISFRSPHLTSLKPTTSVAAFTFPIFARWLQRPTGISGTSSIPPILRHYAGGCCA